MTDAETIAAQEKEIAALKGERDEIHDHYVKAAQELTALRASAKPSAIGGYAASALSFIANNKTSILAIVLAIWGAYREFRPNTPAPDPVAVAVEKLLDRVQALEAKPAVAREPAGKAKADTVEGAK